MKPSVHGLWRTALLLVIFLAAGCASHGPAAPPLAVVPPPGRNDLFGRHMPVLVVHEPERSWNRVGRVVAGPDGVGVDPDRPAVYVRREEFATARGRYTNLVYRFHFEKVPFSLVPFHLTAGRNVGLLVIITLNAHNTPILCTTVHTCGCYLAFIPLAAMPEEMLPPGWPKEEQRVLGERLPARLAVPENGRIALHLRPGTHRVMDAAGAGARLPWAAQAAEILPLAVLRSLDTGEGKTSFFVRKGLRRGHVRGSRKPLEMLLMGWWALDPFVGEDKALGPEEETGTVFYTSLKFWARRRSNLADFAQFLRYWGWRL